MDLSGVVQTGAALVVFSHAILGGGTWLGSVNRAISAWVVPGLLFLLVCGGANRTIPAPSSSQTRLNRISNANGGAMSPSTTGQHFAPVLLAGNNVVPWARRANSTT